MLTDTHAHLYFNHFDDDRDDVIQRAFDAGVKKIINIGIDLETCLQSIEMAEKHQGVYAAVGIHPNDSTKLDDEALATLKEFTRHPKVVAVGEIGLDFYRDHVPIEIQRQAFRKQIALAKDVNLPIIIHNRQAGWEILDILKAESTVGLGGVFHCFSENERMAEEVLDFGFHISFTGNLTFKKSDLSKVARMVPLERLLLETDSPFLSPEPKRGRRNEPSHVVYIAQKLAEIKGSDLAEIENITANNAMRLFGLDRDNKGIRK
ncbi:MAG: TatD family hydrolase [bacterium]